MQQNHDAKQRLLKGEKGNQDKFLLSAIVAPVYNFEDFLQGEHLRQLGMRMVAFPGRAKTQTKNLKKNGFTG